jgi:hypothetical protein
MVDYAGMLDGLLASFGEQVLVNVSGADFPITAAFLHPYVGTAIGGVPVNRPNPQIVARTADWNETGAKNGDKVLRSGIEYTVVNPEPSDDGATTVTLRKYAS